MYAHEREHAEYPVICACHISFRLYRHGHNGFHSAVSEFERCVCVYLCVCLRDISVCAEVSARGIRCERYMHMREISVSEKDIKVAEPHGFTGCINMVSVSHGIICIY